MSKDQGKAADVVNADFFHETSRKLVVRFLLAGWRIEIGADNRASTLVSCNLRAFIPEVG